MVTESFHIYKGYTIRLRAVTYNGFWYSIIKQAPNDKSPNGMKNIYLRQRGWNFILPNELLNKAKAYIDEYGDKLEEKFEKKRKELQCGN